MLTVAGASHRPHELLVARHPANILGRRAALAGNEAGILDGRIGCLDGFDRDAVLPVVPEVVGLGEARDAPLDQGGEPHALLRPDRA